MRKSLFSLLSLLFISTFLFGQIKESEITMSKGSNNSLSLTFQDYDKGNLEYEWKKFIKTFDAKAKRDKKTKEFFADDVLMEKVSEKPIDIYASIIKEDEVTTLTIWFSIDEVFLKSDTHDTEVTALEEILNEFSTNAIIKEVQMKFKADQAKKKPVIREGYMIIGR